MELNNVIRSVHDETTNVSDVLKISLTPVEPEGMHEVKFTRTSTNSRDPKVVKFYLASEDMFELEAAIRVYNRGLVD